MLAALLTMVVGILGAVAQSDIKRLLSFTLVSHIGYMMFGVALASRPGCRGAIFYVVHHITIQTTLFLVTGLIERRGGSSSVDRLAGWPNFRPCWRCCSLCLGGASHCGVGLTIQEAQQLGLDFSRQLADLVQKQDTSRRLLDVTWP